MNGVNKFIVIFLASFCYGNFANSSEFGNYYGDAELESASRVLSIKIIDSIIEVFSYVKDFEAGSGQREDLVSIGSGLQATSKELQSLIDSSKFDHVIDYSKVDPEVVASLQDVIDRTRGGPGGILPKNLTDLYRYHASATWSLGILIEKAGFARQVFGTGDATESGFEMFAKELADFLVVSTTVVVIARQTVK